MDAGKKLRILGHIPYRIRMTTTTCDIDYDKNNENHLAALLIAGIAIETTMDAVKLTNVKTTKEKKERRDKITRLTKLYKELTECVEDICVYVLETKEQKDYDKLNDEYTGKGGKSPIEIVKDIPASIKPIK